MRGRLEVSTIIYTYIVPHGKKKEYKLYRREVTIATTNEFVTKLPRVLSKGELFLKPQLHWFLQYFLFYYILLKLL